MQKKTVCVVGLGYIGLPTAALLASNGFQVAGVELNAHAVETINQGRIHIVSQIWTPTSARQSLPTNSKPTLNRRQQTFT